MVFKIKIIEDVRLKLYLDIHAWLGINNSLKLMTFRAIVATGMKPKMLEEMGFANNMEIFVDGKR